MPFHSSKNGKNKFLMGCTFDSKREMSRHMGRPTICTGENKGADQLRSKNKGADQLRSNCEADQRLCFRYTDSTMSTIPLLYK